MVVGKVVEKHLFLGGVRWGLHVVGEPCLLITNTVSCRFLLENVKEALGDREVEWKGNIRVLPKVLHLSLRNLAPRTRSCLSVG
jgi:hypothetical protein